MEQFINTICKAITLIALLINAESDDKPILPVTRYDVCVSTGVAKSPTSDTTIRRNNSQLYFTTVESV
jgi:hypothetical protein